jgi:CheY-like chemotaxis protein
MQSTEISVLVVDDRPDVAETLADLCRAFGCRAEIAAQELGMLASLEAHQPDCAILDIMMPQQDGYEALKDVARYNPSLPVLLVTGHGDSWLQMGQTLGRAQGLTAVQIAAKPVRAATVKAFLAGVSRRDG